MHEATTADLQANIHALSRAGNLKPSHSDTVSMHHVAANTPVFAGQLNAKNSQYVLDTLNIAIDGCQDGTFDAMVTAPVHKGIINDAGITFTGHTEYLAERTNTKNVVMMLVGGGMRVALATIHIALKDVQPPLIKLI